MIRAVLDANTLVSMFPAIDGALAGLYDHWDRRNFQIVTSEHILIETGRAWSKPYWIQRFSSARAQVSLQLLRTYAELAELALPIIVGLATHPEDDFILATALSAHADYLVTGDRQILKLGQIGTAMIVQPAVFLAILDDMHPG